MVGKVIVTDMSGTREVDRTKSPFPCLVCRKELWNVFDDAKNQPDNACTFNSHGHYGSRVFDSMTGEKLEINVCDDCLTTGKERGFIGYWPAHPKRAMKPWTGE